VGVATSHFVSSSVETLVGGGHLDLSFYLVPKIASGGAAH